MGTKASQGESMGSGPATLQHPTFGECILVPSIIAIRWKTRHTLDEARTILSAYALTLETTLPAAGAGPRGGERDPRPVTVNNSEFLIWASSPDLTTAILESLGADANIEWIAPVYRAAASDEGERSYFAIDPTVLALTPQGGAFLEDIRETDDSVSIDRARSALLRGLTVLNLPSRNAIEIVTTLTEGAGGIINRILFENIPYISPIAGCCSENGSHHAGDHCSPATAPLIPDDTFFPDQWGVQRINAPNAWPLSQGDPNVVIAVLDQGVDLLHPDLNMWPISYSTITHLNDGSAVGPHGTPCAGIIGARINNATGVSGVAGGCRVMAIATFFTDLQVAEGLYFAADNGARVVNISFGVYPSWMIWNFAVIEAALQYCHERDLVLVAISGNENLNISRFPGSDARCICVGGSNRVDVRKSVGDTSTEPWWGACYGPSLDVVAPCLEIPATDQLGGAGYSATDYMMGFNGTSSATSHVAGVAGLLISIAPALTNIDVRRIIAETADKINPIGYPYLPTPGKPYSTWTNEVGYGRINVERALLVACAGDDACAGEGPCCVDVPEPDACCVSPCDPPWRPGAQCMVWYETRLFRVPLKREIQQPTGMIFVAKGEFIEFRIIYEHKMCLLGKQHGPLLYTVTLLPGERVTLYHSDRYRRITTTEQRYSVQTTFSQFLSMIHEARITDTMERLNDRLIHSQTGFEASMGMGISFGPIEFGLDLSSSLESSFTDHTALHITHVSDQFNQSVVQASQLTHSERSLVISTYEERETQDITSRTIQNDNECRAVTYFVRQVVELYSMSTRVSEISFRVIAPGFLPEWHSIGDIAWLPAEIQTQIRNTLRLLPQVGQVTEKPKPISIPTDGAVYDPELAHCCSCEPERLAAITIRLEKEKAEALKACLEAQAFELELQRRRLLLESGDLSPFATSPVREQ